MSIYSIHPITLGAVHTLLARLTQKQGQHP